MPPCEHEDFEASVAVVRLQDTKRFQADIRIVCSQCHEPFRFIGVPAGLSFERPAASIDGLELRAPIEPELVKLLQTKATFQMPPERKQE